MEPYKPKALLSRIKLSGYENIQDSTPPLENIPKLLFFIPWRNISEEKKKYQP